MYDIVRTYDYLIVVFIIHTGNINNPDLILALRPFRVTHFAEKCHMEWRYINFQITGGLCVVYYISPSGSKSCFPLTWI